MTRIYFTTDPTEGTDDALIAAVVDLEVAVDDYTHGVFDNVTNPDEADVPVSVLKAVVVKASTAVALAMTDADVSLVDSTYASVVIPREIRDDAAQHETGTLRALRAARQAREEVPMR
jgi:hypothetical protein